MIAVFGVDLSMILISFMHQKRLLVSVNSDTSVPLLSSLPSYQAVAHAQTYTPITPSVNHGNVNGREEQWVAQTRELTIAPNASPYAHSDDVSMVSIVSELYPHIY